MQYWNHKGSIYNCIRANLVSQSLHLCPTVLWSIFARSRICRRARSPILWRLLRKVFGSRLRKVQEENSRELSEGNGQDISSGVFCLRLLWQDLCQLSILPWRRIALLWRRLEWLVHNQVCVLRVPHRSRRPVGRSPQQQLPQPML